MSKNKPEAAFGAAFSQWYLAQEPRLHRNVGFEYKVTLTGTYNLNTWRKKQGHQEVRMKKVSDDRGIFHTFTDLDPRGTPLDAVFMSNMPSYLVIYFKKHKKFFLIPTEEIPHQTSVSYSYCLSHWKYEELLHKEKKVYNLN